MLGLAGGPLAIVLASVVVLVVWSPHIARSQSLEPEADRWRLMDPTGGVRPRNPLYDPYNPNVLKGDFPLVGDKIFFAATATLDSVFDLRRNLDFFSGNRIRNVAFQAINPVGQLTGTLALEVFRGDTVFQPKDWAVRVTPIVRWRCGDMNAIDNACGEDVRMLETFGEVKLFEIGRTFDATSARLGLQVFNSDFFGLIYNDVQPGGRILSELARNRFKVNLAVFDRLNKEKLSGLNEFERREHQVGVASVQWDDFLVPGLNLLPSVVVSFDENPAGALRAYYVGVAMNGRLDRFNVSGALYAVTGDTARNTPDGTRQDIGAGMAFAQVAYPLAFVTPRLAVAYATGDGDPTDGDATGFDSVFDNVAFGGGQFSYLFGEKIQLGATTVLRGNSVLPSLRGANATSQYVNPGVLAVNSGLDVAVTPKTTLEANVNAVWFDDTATLELLTRRRAVSRYIGVEFNTGLAYRPFLNEQVILFAGGGVLVPGQGIKDLYGDREPGYKILVRAVLTF